MEQVLMAYYTSRSSRKSIPTSSSPCLGDSHHLAAMVLFDCRARQWPALLLALSLFIAGALAGALIQVAETQRSAFRARS